MGGRITPWRKDLFFIIHVVVGYTSGILPFYPLNVVKHTTRISLVAV
jgi:hypothetical protein